MGTPSHPSPSRAPRKAGRPSRERIDAELQASSPKRRIERHAAPGEGPAVPPDPDRLTRRQRLILDFIRTSVDARGYPPSIREMGEAVGLTSPSSVAHQLKVLESKGFLRRDPNRPRALEVVELGPDGPEEPAEEALDPTGLGDAFPEAIHVPLVGSIAAGTPILAAEQVEQVMPLPRDLVGSGTVFMLEVHGDSMVEAAICDGDYVVVRQQPTADNGDIVAALIDDEATVKEFRRADGHVLLLPHNARYEPIDGDQAAILGKVVAVLRRI
ncbi:MAG: transcriptional repressor LexA [Propionibacteriaceae bacterium]|uniref:LexA repressor n=1 Tax=Propionibacterium ruminifibrarum TaxID=1962131 RepID=A0A375I366_9ACTN|nr:transcriptional repressor LexA [Propionibacterium ruminifibrarum]MBE6477042.1 transcriptional repressor LexA [Propionibacteriaceae bacterium]SPF67662.1 Repressor LexA [Propionibacterium ruminifibrarum]